MSLIAETAIFDTHRDTFVLLFSMAFQMFRKVACSLDMRPAVPRFGIEQDQAP
jgi:hypothetical protein